MPINQNMNCRLRNIESQTKVKEVQPKFKLMHQTVQCTHTYSNERFIQLKNITFIF